jgi:tetratricopeptide (TPR) repeat protein
MRRISTLSFVVLAALAPGSPAAQTPPAAEALSAAEAALELQDPSEALRLLTPYLKSNPRDARALLARSTARCMLGEIDPCRTDLERALELDPSLRQGWLNSSAIAISEKRYDDALRALIEAERLDPDALDNAINQGAVELLRGEIEGATRQFRRYLERSPGSANAWYLVASNYAHAGYAAFALEHLQRAVTLDERARVQARSDANFADLANNRTFQQLLNSENFVPEPGSAAAEKRFETLYAGAESPILLAVLNAVQLAGLPMDPRVEVTPDWALLWTDFRIKIQRNRDDTSSVLLSAPPGAFFPATWDQKAARFFSDVEAQLLRLELAAGRQP